MNQTNNLYLKNLSINFQFIQTSITCTRRIGYLHFPEYVKKLQKSRGKLATTVHFYDELHHKLDKNILSYKN